MGRTGGLVVFAGGVLPGERATVRIAEVKATYAVGDVVERANDAPARAEPFCPVFGRCGGCQVQHLAYPEQLAWKRRLVEAALERLGRLSGFEVLPTIGMRDPRAYRNKIALVVERARGGIELGFYEARSHRFVPVEGCPVALPRLDAAIGALREVAHAEPGAFGEVRHAVLRAGAATGEAVLALTTVRPSRAVAAIAPVLGAAIDGLVGVANSYDPAGANAVLGRKTVQVWGRPEMEEEIRGIRYRVSAGSFFQVNSETVGEIFDALVPELGALRVLDLYCGAGTFSVFFARHGARVDGIEENRAAVAEARANAALAGVARQTRFFAGRVEEALRREPGRGALAAADVVFLDPPRKGSDAETLGALTAALPRQIWYLSCNPATLARDLTQLVAAGYRLRRVQPFDMFPQTGHVETLVLLSRA